MRECEYCHKKLTGRYQKRFCSHQCSAKITNHQRAIIRFCLNCKKQLRIGSSQKKYCNRKCQISYNRKLMVEKLERGEYTHSYSGDRFLRQYLVDKRGKKCEECQSVLWMGMEIPLTVHHIDGNASNNLPSNLKFLCWNCHALTDNYGNKNDESSRKYRYKNL